MSDVGVGCVKIHARVRRGLSYCTCAVSQANGSVWRWCNPNLTFCVNYMCMYVADWTLRLCLLGIALLCSLHLSSLRATPHQKHASFSPATRLLTKLYPILRHGCQDLRLARESPWPPDNPDAVDWQVTHPFPCTFLAPIVHFNLSPTLCAINHHQPPAKMPPRFLERMARQAQTLQDVFGDAKNDPPPYLNNRSSRAKSEASSQHSQLKPLPTPPPQYAPDTRPMPAIEQLALPKDSIVLVTGANSWQGESKYNCVLGLRRSTLTYYYLTGMHIVDQLLEHGYRVRGTVRDADKAVYTAKYFKDKYGIGCYSTAIIQDMSKQWAFDIAVRGCVGIVHVASVMTMSPNPTEVITPSIAGAINALEAAHKEINLKRFVLCSGVGAAVSCYRSERNEITSESWNMLDFEDAWAPEPYEDSRAHAVAASSKMQTEAAVWRWYNRRKPQFVLNTGESLTAISRKLSELTSEQFFQIPSGVVHSILITKAFPSPSRFSDRSTMTSTNPIYQLTPQTCRIPLSCTWPLSSFQTSKASASSPFRHPGTSNPSCNFYEACTRKSLAATRQKSRTWA